MIWLFIVITYISSLLWIALLMPEARNDGESSVKFWSSVFFAVPVTWFLSTAMVAMGAF